MSPKASSKSSDHFNKANSLKDLEIQNEIIYNKKNIWMIRLLLIMF